MIVFDCLNLQKRLWTSNFESLKFADFHFFKWTKIPFGFNANEWEPLIHLIKRFFNSWISLWFNNWYKMEDDFSFIFSYDLSGQESWYHDDIKGKLSHFGLLWIFRARIVFLRFSSFRKKIRILLYIDFWPFCLWIFTQKFLIYYINIIRIFAPKTVFPHLGQKNPDSKDFFTLTSFNFEFFAPKLFVYLILHRYIFFFLVKIRIY